ncbi:OmpA family protein [Acidithiobacillus thiooxidans]|uniref:OmpA family protein n=1 Tax=Acidithiobacillus thiooxidans TaxID=930 RepID=UPI001FF090A7|nr:OmpA family protein [Acidithiobacillus thiooxidans]MDX5935833.1 OmpA family protein [Acidithiobacillus thiooxidans]
MSKRKVLLIMGCIMASAGCSNLPFHGCPANKPPEAAPVTTKIPVQVPASSAIAPAQHTVLLSKPITITGINFRLNSSQLMSHDIQVLNEVADFARKYKTAVLHVNGYCSKVGGYLYNLHLSQQRAESVARYLEAHGVPRSRIRLKGYSYKDPVASNATPQGRFDNQRVEINSTIQVKKTVIK